MAVAEAVRIDDDCRSSERSALALRVLNYQHPELVERLKRELGLASDEAEELFMDMKRFLLLCGLRSEGFVPTKKIDAAWHNFIVYTIDYTSFCRNMFGSYIHHLPNSYFFPVSHEKAFAMTLAAARELFGTLGKNWTGGSASSCRPCPRDVRPARGQIAAIPAPVGAFD